MSREELLEKHIEYLEKIVELQDKLIKEIEGKSHIVPDYRPHNPWDTIGPGYQPVPWTSGDIVLTNDSISTGTSDD